MWTHQLTAAFLFLMMSWIFMSSVRFLRTISHFINISSFLICSWFYSFFRRSITSSLRFSKSNFRSGCTNTTLCFLLYEIVFSFSWIGIWMNFFCFGAVSISHWCLNFSIFSVSASSYFFKELSAKFFGFFFTPNYTVTTTTKLISERKVT